MAARAGVSKGTLFLYFPSKEELFKAVVRENISGRFREWNEEFRAFEGSSADMVRYCLKVWWERVGDTRASGITKLMMSEAQNFPELAAFYHQEVVQPGQDLIRRILQRGIDRGEFRADRPGVRGLQPDGADGVPGDDEALAGRLLPQDYQLDPRAFHRGPGRTRCCTACACGPDDTRRERARNEPTHTGNGW